MNNHFTELVKDVLPKEDIKTLINQFMIDASINMGNDFTDASLERAIQIVETNFRFLPVYAVEGAFKKGSLGNYGTGRLVPRTIYGWLNEVAVEYNREVDHKRLTDIVDVPHFKDLDRYPLGKAICKKIDWYKSGLINDDEWDKIPLKNLAEMIGRGEMPTLEKFI